MIVSRHPADFLSLAFGLLFSAIGLVLLSGGFEALSLEWVAPLAAIALGGILILAGRSARTESGSQPPQG
jgi:uncharacterized membrane protein YbhN (UPF0104 family)